MSSRSFEEAVDNGDIDAVKNLLLKCDINIVRDAVIHGRLTDVKKKVEKQKTQRKLVSRLLQQDFKKSDKEYIKRLLEEHLNINGGTGGDGNALYAASSIATWPMSTEEAAAEKKFTILYLLREGAIVNKKSGMYGSALAAASAKGNIEIVQLLLEAGANPNAKDGKEGKYGDALATASALGRLEIALLLLQNGANNIKGAILAASRRKNVEIIDLLNQHQKKLYRSAGTVDTPQYHVSVTTICLYVQRD